jgi:Tfp pilus assembly protein PilN
MQFETDASGTAEYEFDQWPSISDRPLARFAHVEPAVLRDLEAFARDHAIVIESVTPADFAWVAATLELDSGSGRQVCAIHVPGITPHIRLLAIADGVLVAMRRLPAGAHGPILSSALRSLAMVDDGGQPTMAVALGDLGFRERVGEAAAEVGLNMGQPSKVVVELEFSPERVAAAFAGVGPRFVPTDVVRAAQARNGRGAAAAGIMAVLLLIVTATVYTLDLRRELAATALARTAYAGALSEMLDQRGTLERLTEVAQNLDNRRRGTPRWTLLLTSLAEELPDGARLVSLRAGADSVHLDIAAPDAAAAFEAVRSIPWLTGFQATAPVQREVGAVSELTERISASASVSWVDLNGRVTSGDGR